jgi:hypothetical protein
MSAYKAVILHHSSDGAVVWLFPSGLSRKLISVPFFVKYLIFSAEYGMIVKAIPHKDRLTALCGIA